MKILDLPPKKLVLPLLIFTLAVAGVTWSLTADPMRTVSVILASNLYVYLLLQKQPTNSGSSVKILILDRSGLYASGVPELKALKSIDSRISELALMQRVASLLYKNDDLLSRTVLAAARGKSLELLEVEQFRSVPDQGVVGVVSQRKTFVGSAAFLRSEGIQPGPLESLATSLIREGHKVSLIGADGKAIGIVAVSEPSKLESIESVQRARAIGIEVALLSGESAEIAKSHADQMGITRVYSDVTPAKKSEIVKQIQKDSGGEAEFIVGDLNANVEKFEQGMLVAKASRIRLFGFVLYNVFAPISVAVLNWPPLVSLAIHVPLDILVYLRQRITS